MMILLYFIFQSHSYHELLKVIESNYNPAQGFETQHRLSRFTKAGAIEILPGKNKLVANSFLTP